MNITKKFSNDPIWVQQLQEELYWSLVSLPYELAKALSQVNPDLDIDSVRALLDDLVDLGFILQFKKHCTVKYRFPGSNKTCTMLYLTTDAQFFHQVDTLGTQLSRMNFSSEIASQYWDEMLDLLNNQSQDIFKSRGISNYFASGSISNLIENKEKFLTILEKFMRSFA